MAIGPTDSKSKRQRQPRLEELAAAGDVDALWDTVANTPWTRLDVTQALACLLYAAEAAGRANPARFAAGLFARMNALTAQLCLRAQIQVRRQLADGTRRGDPLPADVMERALPPLLALHQHAGQLLELQARTARLWELVRAKKVARKRRRKVRRATAASPPDVEVLSQPQPKTLPSVAIHLLRLNGMLHAEDEASPMGP